MLLISLKLNRSEGFSDGKTAWFWVRGQRSRDCEPLGVAAAGNLKVVFKGREPDEVSLPKKKVALRPTRESER